MNQFSLFLTDVELDEASAQLWDAYAVAERIRRGLPPDAPLDVAPDGTPTTITTRYVEPIRIPGQVGGVLSLDDWAQTIIAGSVALASLPEPWRSHIQAMYDV